VHVLEHPSPFTVLPSSHSSELCFLPSPQTVIQAVIAPFKDCPFSVQTVQSSGSVAVPPVQKDEASITHPNVHPSLFSTFPSSQASEACFLPSPHCAVQAVLSAFGDVPPAQTVHVSAVVVVPPEQAESASISQTELHPSPSAVFPSSHSSEECSLPSPQITDHAPVVG